ncbi:MAG TPA: hypothetical protein VIH53_07310, partial [Gemmatimonadaceae bacterium]
MTERFIRRPAIRAFCFLGALCWLMAPVALQAQASAYVPLDDIAYTYVDALMARGALGELAVLERPFTQRALSASIDSARTREPSAIVASYLDALSDAVLKYAVQPHTIDPDAAQTFHARFTGDVYLVGQTSGRRE